MERCAMSYHRFKDVDGEEHGSFEIFYNDGEDGLQLDMHPAGYYWWACFPGCMPDGDPMGPFETEDEAIDNANDF